MTELELKNAVRVTPSTKIHFKCTGCGECCRHVKETVPVDSQDVFRITKHLRDSGSDIFCTDQFLERYAEPALIDECGYFVYFLKSVGEDHSCVFLKDNRCMIHTVKPRACRLYPFIVDPNESGAHRYLYAKEREHHFQGPIVETRAWMKKNFPKEDREFLTADFSSAGTIAMLLKKIPVSRKTEALLHFHRLRYSAFKLDVPFLDQFRRNQEKLLTILFRMAEGMSSSANNQHF